MCVANLPLSYLSNHLKKKFNMVFNNLRERVGGRSYCGMVFFHISLYCNHPCLITTSYTWESSSTSPSPLYNCSNEARITSLIPLDCQVSTAVHHPFRVISWIFYLRSISFTHSSQQHLFVMLLPTLKSCAVMTVVSGWTCQQVTVATAETETFFMLFYLFFFLQKQCVMSWVVLLALVFTVDRMVNKRYAGKNNQMTQVLCSLKSTYFMQQQINICVCAHAREPGTTSKISIS